MADLTQLVVLRAGDAGFLVGLDALLSELFIERADVDTEVLGDLRVRDTVITIQCDSHDIITNSFGFLRAE